MTAITIGVYAVKGAGAAPEYRYVLRHHGAHIAFQYSSEEEYESFETMSFGLQYA